MDSEKFCLRWNDFKEKISESFRDLREEKEFFDVTLACEDNQIQAHKVILSACSPFFRNILRRNPHQHPLLYLKDVKYKELLSVINFMYLGEVSVAQDELNSFLNVAEELRVKGLTQSTKENSSYNTQTERGPFKQENHYKKPPDRYIDPPLKRPKQNASHIRPPPQAAYIKKVENDVQEVAAIKSEPREPTQQRPPVRSYQGIAQARYEIHNQQIEQEQELEQEEIFDQDDGQEQGTVAVDEGYAVDVGYDYQYDDAGYEAAGGNTAYNDGLQGDIDPFANINKDLDSVILSKMSRNEAGDWQCNDCYRTSNKKINIMEHIEASHVESPGYNCEICYKIFKTKHSLRTHKNVKHKELKYVQQ